MLPSPDKAPSQYVYRRIVPPLYKIKRNEVGPDAFVPDEGMRGLSVFRADIASPRAVLQARLEDARRDLLSADDARRQRAERFLQKNPDVETLVQKAYRIVEIPIEEISAMGFGLEEPDEQGHLNILGSRDEFEARKLDFTELVMTARARILTAEECLAD